MTSEYLWELMQRDLDDNLSPEEQQLLHSSMQKDPELQLMYERLKKVSDQLEQLPPVTPAFSIVDSILPKLEATPLQPAAVSTSVETELPRLERKTSTPAAHHPKRQGLPVWMARVGSGVAAACLLFGLFWVVNGPQTNGPDAREQGSIVTPASSPTPSGIVPPLPEKDRSNLIPSSKEATEPPATTTTPSKNNASDPNKKMEKPPATLPKQNPIKNKPAVTAQPVEERQPTFPSGSEIKPGKDDKPDKDEKGNDDKGKKKGHDKNKKRDDDRAGQQNDDADDEDQGNNGHSRNKGKKKRD